MPLTEVLFDSGFALHAEQLVDGGRIEVDDGRLRLRDRRRFLLTISVALRASRSIHRYRTQSGSAGRRCPHARRAPLYHRGSKTQAAAF
jgi:hypothetical protein